MKKLAWYTAVGLATLTFVFVLWEFRTAVIIFILSLMVAAVVRPMVDKLTLQGIPRWLALVITYLVIAVMFIALGLFFIKPVITEIQALATDLPDGYQQFKTQWLTGTGLQQAIAQSMPDLNKLFQIITSGQWNNFIQNFVGFTIGSVTLIGEMVVVMILSIYWSADQEHFKRLWLSLLPFQLRTRWRDIWQNIEIKIGSYLRSEIIQSLLTLIILAVGYQLIGLKYPVFLAVFGAISWLFAWVGGLVAVIAGLLAGLAISPAIGILSALFTILVLAFLEFIVEPRLFNRQRLSSLLMLIMVLIMVKQYGIIGFLAAPPVAVAIQIIGRQIYQTTTATAITLPPPPDIQIEILRERLRSVQTLITNRSEPPTPEIISLIDRIDTLIAKADQEELIRE
jgi:predicted PurR-regulated permease PerM